MTKDTVEKGGAEKGEQQEDLSQREHTRFRTVYSGSVRQKGKAQDCVIKDLSANGAKIKDAMHLIDSEELSLVINRLGPYQALRAKVQWRSADRLGISFLDPTDQVQATLAELFPNRWAMVEKKTGDK